MITTNINVTDGLTHGAMGTVTNVVINKRTGKNEHHISII